MAASNDTPTYWQVVAVDWPPPDNVIETFEGDNAEQRAREHADRLDGLALRAYARPAVEA